MLRAGMRKIHNWTFTIVGVFMLLWVITGIVISLPVSMHWHKPVSEQLAEANLAAHRISPADIFARFRVTAPGSEKVDSIELETFHNKLIYVVTDATSKKHLFDAQTGETYSLTPDAAEAIVRQAFHEDTQLLEISSVNEHSYDYLWGELPVYRLKFDDSSSVVYYVSPSSGQVMKSSWLTRIGSLSTTLHDFGPVYTITGSDVIRMLLIMILGAVALVGSATGLYLTLPRRRRVIK